MAALPLVLISGISNAVLNLQLCIMNLTALNHRKRRRKRLQLLLMLKDSRKRTNGRTFPREDYFGSGLGDVMNGRTTLLLKE